MTTFKDLLIKEVINLGGWFNAHAHIDRAYILDPSYLSHADMDPWEVTNYPLTVKQHVTGDIHTGQAYTRESLRERMRFVLNESISKSVRRLDSAIDTTADIKYVALHEALDLKEEYKDKIDFRVGAYPIFGFKDDEPERWDMFYNSMAIADYAVTLPERDDRPGHIGYDEHLRKVIRLCDSFDMPLHIHVDQTNLPTESGLERLIEAVRWLKPSVPVWAIHALSVASYDEERFQKVVKGLKETGIGIIVCPNATLSNKQNHNVVVPMHNSITRVLDFLVNDIPVRIGTDNISDVMCPEGTDMLDEVKTAARALRFYHFTTWAKVGCGVKLTEVDKMKIRKAM